LKYPVSMSILWSVSNFNTKRKRLLVMKFWFIGPHLSYVWLSASSRNFITGIAPRFMSSIMTYVAVSYLATNWTIFEWDVIAEKMLRYFILAICIFGMQSFLITNFGKTRQSFCFWLEINDFYTARKLFQLQTPSLRYYFRLILV